MNRFLRACLLPLALFALVLSTVAPSPVTVTLAIVSLGAWLLHVINSPIAHLFRMGYLGTDPTGCHSDGSLQFGSQTVTVNTVAFEAEDISYEKGATPLTRRNRYGIPQAEVLREDIGTGSMTLQLPDATTVAPTIGGAFTLIDVGGVSISCKLSKIGRMWKQDDLIKLQVDFRDKLN